MNLSDTDAKSIIDLIRKEIYPKLKEDLLMDFHKQLDAGNFNIRRAPNPLEKLRLGEHCVFGPTIRAIEFQMSIQFIFCPFCGEKL